MKKIIVLLLVVCCCLSLLAGCANTSNAETTETTQTIPAVTGPEALDGKKIIFIGNSYTFYGKVVTGSGYDVLTQAERSNDQAYFYQLCKKNDIDVSVTNWTFGSHSISDSMYGACEADTPCNGEYHNYFLKDTCFDYVAFQFSTRDKDTGDYLAYLQPAIDVFRKANPNVKFLILVPYMAYQNNWKSLESLEKLKEQGFIICNWGKMLYDIVNNTVSVPGAEQTYERSTFIISQSEKDGHHQNLLAGYLTTLMVYCAITGESAVGQDYSFCGDMNIDKSFNFESFKLKYYSYIPDTNFIEVFESEADMKGLQQLVDQYLGK